MIQFIVCEDDNAYASKINNIINQVLFQEDDEYQITNYKINEVNLESRESSNKIYIIDLACNMDSALSLATKIRETDIQSHIIFVDQNEHSLQKVLNGHYLWLAYIDKSEITNKLPSFIKYLLKFIGRKQELIIKQRNAVIKIPIDDILYIMANVDKRGSIIVTSYSEYVIREPLSSLKKRLNENFYHSHRACLINVKRVRMVNWENREITFDNGTKTDLLSFRESTKLKKML